MDTLDQFLRLLLFVGALMSVIGWTTFVRLLWPDRPWPIRIVFIGLGGSLFYILAGQARAYELGLSFNFVSWLGLISISVLNTGMVWTIAHVGREKE